MLYVLIYAVLPTFRLKDFVTKENASFHAAVEEGEGSQTLEFERRPSRERY